jgi:hypothetical protein
MSAAIPFDTILDAMRGAADEATARRILDLNLPRFPDRSDQLRAAFLRRLGDFRDDHATLEQDVWMSVELGSLMTNGRWNPDNRNPQQMPALIRKHGAKEALRRTIVNAGPEGTKFFQRCVAAGDLRFTSEAIALRHQEEFADAPRVLAVASERLARFPGLKV